MIMMINDNDQDDDVVGILMFFFSLWHDNMNMITFIFSMAIIDCFSLEYFQPNDDLNKIIIIKKN